MIGCFALHNGSVFEGLRLSSIRLQLQRLTVCPHPRRFTSACISESRVEASTLEVLNRCRYAGCICIGTAAHKSEAFMISGALILCVSSKPCLFLPICICHPWDLTIHAFGTTGHSKRDGFTGFSADVYCSSLRSGKLVLLNFTEILACISYSYLPCSCN